MPQNHISKVSHHYILTDEYHGIACVSEGLAHEVGIHSKFFAASDIFHVPIHIDRLFKKSITTPEIQKELETPYGSEVLLDTSTIL